MNHTIILHFEDDTTRSIQCGADDTIADAAYRQKINLPMDCRDGVCGTCKAHLERGEVDMGSYIEDALSNEDVAQGYVLACQCKPRSGCVLRVLASSASCKVAPATHAGKLLKVDRMSATTIAFSVTLDHPETLVYLPGQYVNVTIPGTSMHRSYSFSSAPGAAVAEFLVRDVPNGKMSGFLRDRAEEGAAVGMTGPYGAFYLRQPTRRILMLAGGTGLAPFLSMLAALDATPGGVPVHLIYGVTRDEDLVGIAELDRHAAVLPGFTYETCVADESSAHPRKGYVTHHIRPEHVDDGNVDVYLCGPPPMVEAVTAWMRAQSLTPANFYFERFAASSEVMAA